jgi:hypothetical protein
MHLVQKSIYIQLSNRREDIQTLIMVTDFIWKELEAFISTHGKLFDSADFAFSSEPLRLSSQSNHLPCLKPTFTQQLHLAEMEKSVELNLEATKYTHLG